MAEEDKENNVVVSKDQLSTLQNRAALNKTLLISVLIISSIVFAIMGTGLTVMYMRISVLTSPAGSSEDELQQQISTIEQQIVALDDFRTSELKEISLFTQQLEKTAADCNVQKTISYQAFLESRETDFQLLLNTVKSGASNLASMSKGSKKWLDSHNDTLNKLNKSSLDRKQSIKSL
jgi:hypothetical protein